MTPVDENRWKTWTEEDIIKACIVMGKAMSTIKQTIRYLRYIENEYGVNLHQHPDKVHAEFLEKFVIMKRGEEKEHSIRNATKAMKLLFISLGVAPVRYIWPKTHSSDPQIVVVPDDAVYNMINGEYTKDKWLNATFQHIFHWIFYSGARTPSEINMLKIGKKYIDFDVRRVTWWQPKVRSWRTSYFPKFVVSSPVDKSLRHYIEYVRPQLADREPKEGEPVFVNQYGEPFTPNYLRCKLSSFGKKYYSSFHPYAARHTCFTNWLVRSYLRHRVMDIMGLKLFANHKDISSTMVYVHPAEQIIMEYQQRQHIGKYMPGKRSKKNFNAQKTVAQNSICKSHRIPPSPLLITPYICCV